MLELHGWLAELLGGCPYVIYKHLFLGPLSHISSVQTKLKYCPAVPSSGCSTVAPAIFLYLGFPRHVKFSVTQRFWKARKSPSSSEFYQSYQPAAQSINSRLCPKIKWLQQAAIRRCESSVQ